MCRTAGFVTALWLALTASALDPDRDFSGKWHLDAAASDARAIADAVDPWLSITSTDSKIQCNSAAGEWVYALDGSENLARRGEESRNSAVKWEGTALLINTLVSGPRNYVIMDRWKLSRDHNVLTVGRQIDRSGAQAEGRLIYRREGAAAPAPAPISTSGTVRTPVNPPATPPATATYTVRAGTRILLLLINSVDTKHSHQGDRIYLETAVPVSAGGRIVVPRGSSVAGTVTETKKPGRVAGRAELFVRFESLTLPNGVTRDFRSRLVNAEDEAGKVDRKEGKVTGNSNKSGDARTVAESAGTGASIGGIAGAAGGQVGKGVGIGAAAGAAAGVAQVLLKRGPDAVLQKGSKVEMILDRDLTFTASELGF